MVEVKKKGKKTVNNEMFDKLDMLSEGEYTVVKKEEWTMKTRPGQHLIRRRLGREFKVETLSDDSGWKITALPQTVVVS